MALLEFCHQVVRYLVRVDTEGIDQYTFDTLAIRGDSIDHHLITRIGLTLEPMYFIYVKLIRVEVYAMFGYREVAGRKIKIDLSLIHI